MDFILVRLKIVVVLVLDHITTARGATTDNHATLAARRDKALQAEVRTILSAFAQLAAGQDVTINFRLTAGISPVL